MSGETDLERMLSDLKVSRRPGTFTFVAVGHGSVPDEGVHATVTEAEGLTLIVETEVARSRGWQVDFEAAWLTLEVHSSLEAVGLTAAVAGALAAESIPCNVIAGYHHDHLLVPLRQAEEAERCITRLRRPGPAG